MENSNLKSQDKDLFFLSQALELAKIRAGFCAPNPSVGALITNLHDEVIASGYHLEAGAAHAEVEALCALTNPKAAIDGTLYVTLEPCCHWGKTPPCTDLLIKSGIKRVVYGYKDPNPIVAGKGALALQTSGIHCDYLPHNGIQLFYSGYNHWIKTQKPFVTAKIAMTLNGKIAGGNGEPKKITGKQLQEFTHYNRKQSDAILTTATTIISDNPQLNVRYQNEIYSKPIYIIDSELKTPTSANIFSTAKSITLFHKETADPEKKHILQTKAARCIEISNTLEKLSKILDHIGKDGIHNLWVEAGGKLFSSLLKKQLAQRAFIYIAPKWLEHGKSAVLNDVSFLTPGSTIRWTQMGEDAMCEISYI
ncbi:MAG: bifunctional diaminohydroxyphosphoribosylaminopyrimidine deaminase/5-amino-6-(5-phosphoribosylamino)uracil reductase RibD [Gammaproteobacteria bacterium]|nr:bifunctional diaminohydroxyphosphoribosylaminopyrimidine deaminase/5-amino-6-(5-phosphoribosylamino)uracil reductase RibD [Gammaproteobacteria bacterium]